MNQPTLIHTRRTHTKQQPTHTRTFNTSRCVCVCVCSKQKDIQKKALKRNERININQWVVSGLRGPALWSALLGQSNGLIHHCLQTMIPQMQYSKWPPACFGSWVYFPTSILALKLSLLHWLKSFVFSKEPEVHVINYEFLSHTQTFMKKKDPQKGKTISEKYSFK